MNRRLKWLVLAGLVVAGAALGMALGGGRGRRVTGERLSRYLPTASEVAVLSGAPPENVRAVAPPINPEYAETAARALSHNRLPLPDDRAVVTYRRSDRPAETTIALLLYDRASDADRVAELAGPLLQQALGLEPGEAVSLPTPAIRLPQLAAASPGPKATAGTPRRSASVAAPGQAEPADRTGQLWRGPGYRAVAFRSGNVIGLIGTSDALAEDWLVELAALVSDRLLAQPPATSTAAPATPWAPTTGWPSATG